MSLHPNEPLLTAAKPPSKPAPAPAVVVVAAEPPKILEYTPPTALDRWQVERFDLLAVYFQLVQPWAEIMAQFHGFAESDTQRWFYVRRLFGVQPLIPGNDTHPDDLRYFTPDELCEATGLKPDQLADEMTHLRVAWEAWQTEAQRVLADGHQFADGPHLNTSTHTQPRELDLGDALLRRFDFDKSLFEVETYNPKLSDMNERYIPRSTEKNRQEMDWFLAKLGSGEAISVVGKVDGEIRGEATLHRSLHGWSRHVGEIRLNVDRAARGQGLGLELARHIVKLAIDRGIDKLVAHMVESQIAAKRTFEKLGFHKEAELPGHVTDIHGKRRDLLIFANDVSHVWSAMESMLGDFRPDRATR